MNFQGAPAGPLFGPNFIVTTHKDQGGTEYSLTIFPDVFNEDLRKSGKQMAFYYMPDFPRMAKSENGGWKFHFTKFAGVMDPDANIAIEKRSEVAGGVLAFTSTLKIPPMVLEQARARIKQECTGGQRAGQRYWNWAQGQPDPLLGCVPITKNSTYIASITMNDISDPKKIQEANDPWYWKMQGEGDGTINPNGENAYTAMVGQYPAAIVEQSFKGESSPIFVHTALDLKFWTGAVHIDLEADASKVFDHFSAAFNAGWLFGQVDLAAEYNRARSAGVFTATLTIDGDVVTPEKQKDYEAQMDKMMEKFMEWAKQTVFDVQNPKVEPATAKRGGGIFGDLFGSASFSMKKRHDVNSINLSFHEKINQTVHYTNVISADLKGFFNELKADADAAKKYFSTVYLDEAFKKVHVIVGANAYWPDAQGEKGDPINKLAVEIGYPDQNGVVAYKGSAPYREGMNGELSANNAPCIWTKDNKERIYVFDFARHPELDAEADKVHVKRHVWLNEDPRVEVNQIDVPEELTAGKILEVRAETLGMVNVGPITLDMPITSEQVQVNVLFAKGNRQPDAIAFTKANDPQLLAQSEQQIKPVFWKIWSQPTQDVISWKYKVEVVVKGKKFGQPPLRYGGDWVNMKGNGPVVILVPPPTDDISAKLEQYLS